MASDNFFIANAYFKTHNENESFSFLIYYQIEFSNQIFRMPFKFTHKKFRDLKYSRTKCHRQGIFSQAVHWISGNT